MGHKLHILSDGSECVPYNMDGYPVYAGQSWLSDYHQMGLACHWHDDLEFGYVTEGKMTYSINGELMTLRKGLGIFINSRQLHFNYSADGSNSRYLCVLIHPSLLLNGWPQVDKPLRRLLSHPGWPYQTLVPEIGWQQELLRTVASVYNSMKAFNHDTGLQIQMLGYGIVHQLMMHMPAINEQSLPTDHRLPALHRMLGLIQSRYDEKITLKELCQAGQIGSSTCYLLFQKHLQTTPLHYVTRYRLQKALERLKNPALSITDVALSTGFSSLSYFTECFHRELGETPTEYRKRNTAETILE